ncbi:MAG: TOBE domain-containing protein, partial [Bacilli bacterium]
SFGIEATVGIRPEVISFSNEAVDRMDTLSIPGQVTDVTLRGTIVRYTVKTGDEELFVDTLSNGTVTKQSGDRVILTIPKKQMIQL